MEMKADLRPIGVETRRQSHPLPLLAFQDKVERCRTSFLQELEKLPDPLNRVAIGHYTSRVKRGNGRAVLGEYAPWLIADLAGIADDAAVERIMLPWLCIYTYIIFTDALIDEQNVEEKDLLLIASGLLLERGLSHLSKLAFNSDVLLTFVDEYFTQTAIAAISELKEHRSLVQSYSDDDLRNLGRKVSVLKLCARYALASRGITDVGNLEFTALDNLFSGIQLLDDITDWEEDWRMANYTFPLTLAFERLVVRGITRATNPQTLEENEVLVGLVLTGALEETLHKALGFLTAALTEAEAKATSDSPGVKFLEVIIHNCEWFRAIVRRSRFLFEEERSEYGDPDWLAQTTRKNRARQEIYKIRLVFPVVAQES